MVIPEENFWELSHEGQERWPLVSRYRGRTAPPALLQGGRREKTTPLPGYLRPRCGIHPVNSTGPPFCLSVSFNAPHAVDGDPVLFYWPQYCDGLYTDHVFPYPVPSAQAIFESQPEFIRRSLGRTRWSWRFDTHEKFQRMIRGYYRMTTCVDREIGRILKELEVLDFGHNTVIILASDNGYFLGERGLAGKWLLHEPSIRIPLIVYDPRSSPTRRGVAVDDLALNLDIAPTILELAGIRPPGHGHGKRLGPEPGERRNTGRTEVLLEHLYDHPKIPRSEGVRTMDWKYIRYLDHPDYEELYDLRRNTQEAENLALNMSMKGVLENMRSLCDEMISRYT